MAEADTAGVEAAKLLLTYYGDDFTGSTDSLEALATAGIRTVLFLAPPTPERLADFEGVRAVGVAGVSRSKPPAWMDAELPDVFRALKALGAPTCHYKTCSTFDSSPEIGNIGRAAEIGGDVFGGPVPVVVGVVRHKRYVMFGNLFAAGAFSGSQQIHRIDRHPTMSRHPVTPMTEADLTLHLGKQTGRRIAGFNYLDLLAEDGEARFVRLIEEGAELVVVDTFDEATTVATGKLIHDRPGQAFVVGSSGVEYALVAYLRSIGEIPEEKPTFEIEGVERIVAVCGSCSPVTAGQIDWAEANGFAVVAVDSVAAVTPEGHEAERRRAVAAAGEALAAGQSVVLHTARGPDDPRVETTRRALDALGIGHAESSGLLGGFLGAALEAVLAESGVRRVVFAGGDSSSYAVQSLGVEALEMSAPLVPGAPLCRLHARAPHIDGVEVALKGGQVGARDFFRAIRMGRL